MPYCLLFRWSILSIDVIIVITTVIVVIILITIIVAILIFHIVCLLFICKHLLNCSDGLYAHVTEHIVKALVLRLVTHLAKQIALYMLCDGQYEEVKNDKYIPVNCLSPGTT